MSSGAGPGGPLALTRGEGDGVGAGADEEGGEGAGRQATVSASARNAESRILSGRYHTRRGEAPNGEIGLSVLVPAWLLSLATGLGFGSRLFFVTLQGLFAWAFGPRPA